MVMRAAASALQIVLSRAAEQLIEHRIDERVAVGLAKHGPERHASEQPLKVDR